MPCSYVHLGLEERRRARRLREANVVVAEIAAARRSIARSGAADSTTPRRPRRRATNRLGRGTSRHAGDARGQSSDATPSGATPLWTGHASGPRRRIVRAAGRSIEPPLPRRPKRGTRPSPAQEQLGVSRVIKANDPVFPGRVAIRHRPLPAKDRAELGRQEVDRTTLRKRHEAAGVATAIKRSTRRTTFLRNRDRRSRPIMGRASRGARATARRRFALDRGPDSVFRAASPRLVLRPPGALAKADLRDRPRPPPASSVEGNGCAGDPGHCHPGPPDAAPCKCLGWRSPAEAFRNHLVELPTPAGYPAPLAAAFRSGCT